MIIYVCFEVSGRRSTSELGRRPSSELDAAVQN
jgi:hypothetical protein